MECLLILRQYFIVTEYYFTLKMISGEIDRNISSLRFKSCVINFYIEMKLLVVLFIIKIFARINIFKKVHNNISLRCVF